MIVNEANDVDAMTKDEVAQIFSGASTGREWHVYAMDDRSGTYDTFKDRVLGSRSLVSTAKPFEDSRSLATAVAQDRNGIGFVGLPYAVGVKVLAVAEKGISGGPQCDDCEDRSVCAQPAAVFVSAEFGQSGRT